MGHLSQISQSASIQFPNRWYSSFAITERSLVLFRIPLLLMDLLLQQWVLSVCMYKKFLKVMGQLISCMKRQLIYRQAEQKKVFQVVILVQKRVNPLFSHSYIHSVSMPLITIYHVPGTVVDP